MRTMFHAMPGRCLAVALGVGLCITPSVLRAQTLDSGAGIGPSQKLSTPPNADPINQPGAMRRSVQQQHLNAMRAKTHQTAPVSGGGSAPPK
ncbi:hypothetical protein [Lichenicoccus sp.]|uniref:hypothetical protein n=1 Tax=Lichenicoccus sp. TaxID=2781899 RepID=UPI003D0DE274